MANEYTPCDLKDLYRGEKSLLEVRARVTGFREWRTPAIDEDRRVKDEAVEETVHFSAVISRDGYSASLCGYSTLTGVIGDSQEFSVLTHSEQTGQSVVIGLARDSPFKDMCLMHYAELDSLPERD